MTDIRQEANTAIDALVRLHKLERRCRCCGAPWEPGADWLYAQACGVNLWYCQAFPRCKGDGELPEAP